MQAWKIKRMSVKTLDKWLDAIGKLLSHYLGIHELNWLDCPICFPGCKECLWTIIERKHCSDFKVEIYPKKPRGIEVGHMRRHFNTYRKWTKARISQLMNWEKIIMTEREGRK